MFENQQMMDPWQTHEQKDENEAEKYLVNGTLRLEQLAEDQKGPCQVLRRSPICTKTAASRAAAGYLQGPTTR